MLDTGFQYVDESNDQRPIAKIAKIVSVKSSDGFQLCPKCNGSGQVGRRYATTDATNETCPVCKGKMIINKITGQPPA